MDYMVCVYCDSASDLGYCPRCNEYKGMMTTEDWESYTGLTWQE